jgi:hypothetical protein
MGDDASRGASDTVYTIWVVSPAGYSHSQAFDEVAIALRAAFRTLGYAASIVRNPDELAGTAIVLGANLLAKRPALIPDSARLILFNLEQISPNSPWIDHGYLRLLQRYRVWDYSTRNITALAGLGIVAVHCGIGYVPELTRIRPVVEDIDVLFVGSLNARRQAVLRELSARGARAVVRFNVYGEARDALIGRSKLVLNVHYFESKVLEIVRVSYLLANRKCVVCEIGEDPLIEAPLRDGLALVPYDLLVDTCLDLLQDDAKRRAIGAAGFAAFSTLSQVEYLQHALSDTARLPQR